VAVVYAARVVAEGEVYAALGVEVHDSHDTIW
jgi:hypothetical protein